MTTSFMQSALEFEEDRGGLRIPILLHKTVLFPLVYFKCLCCKPNMVAHTCILSY